MAVYILLMTLTPEGQERLLHNSSSLVEAASQTKVPDVTGLGLYGVLGPYDFVGIVEAPDNDAVARYSIQLGVKAGVHITTLPAVPVALLRDLDDERDPFLTTGAEVGTAPDDQFSPRS